MLKFPRTISCYPSGDFKQALKDEIEQCDKKLLPLEKCTTQGGYVSDEPVTATILKVGNKANTIEAHVGIFFTEIVICCGCGDDPMPANAYCEMNFNIDKKTAQVEIKII